MIGEMLRGSAAVLRSPRVETFEAHGHGSFVAGCFYVVVGLVLAIALDLFGLYRDTAEMAPLSPELVSQLEAAGVNPGPFMTFEGVLAESWRTFVISGFILPLVLYLATCGVAYLIGRALGGSGDFGSLAYSFALFDSPLRVILAAVRVIAVGPWGLVGTVAGFASVPVTIYLAYVAIRASLGLDKERASFVVGVLGLGGLALFLLFLAAVYGMP